MEFLLYSVNKDNTKRKFPEYVGERCVSVSKFRANCARERREALKFMPDLPVPFDWIEFANGHGLEFEIVEIRRSRRLTMKDAEKWYSGFDSPDLYANMKRRIESGRYSYYAFYVLRFLKDRDTCFFRVASSEEVMLFDRSLIKNLTD